MQQRLHVIIAKAGVASRRKAEELIAHGNVRVNGKTVKTLGVLADPEKDTITVNEIDLPKAESKLYTFMLYKPQGIVSTASDPDGKRTVVDLFTKYWKTQPQTEKPPRVYPVGRLDEESEGLILLTNDGDLAYKLTHPKFEVPKTYEAWFEGAPSATALHTLASPMRFKEGTVTANDVHVIGHDQGNTWVSLTIHQGLHHQVRRMADRAGLTVKRLVRVRMGPYELGELRPGEMKQVNLGVSRRHE